MSDTQVLLPSETIALVLLLLSPFLAVAFVLQAMVISTVGSFRWFGWTVILASTLILMPTITAVVWIVIDNLGYGTNTIAGIIAGCATVVSLILPWLVLPWRRFR